MKPLKDRIPLEHPPDNQVPGPVSNDRGHSTNALPDVVQQPQGKGHSTRGYSTRTRLSKGHSTHQLLRQGHSTLGHSSSALPGPKRDLQSKSHSTHTARITRSTSCCDRITRPARCQSTDQRIECVNSSAGTGSSGRR